MYLATMESFYMYADDDALQMNDGGDLLQEDDHRLLQTNFTETAALTDTEILRTTCKLYGSIFAILFFLFLLVRNMKREVFNLKKTYPELATPVAEVSFCPASAEISALFFLSFLTLSLFSRPHTNEQINIGVSRSNKLDLESIWRLIPCHCGRMRHGCGNDASTL